MFKEKSSQYVETLEKLYKLSAELLEGGSATLEEEMFLDEVNELHTHLEIALDMLKWKENQNEKF